MRTHTAMLAIVLALATATASAKTKKGSTKKATAAGGTVTFHEPVPGDIKDIVAHLVAVIRSGDRAKAAAIAAPTQDLVEFWSGAGDLHAIRFHAWYDAKTKAVTLSDGGMYSCEATKAGANWLLDHCMFNDGF